MNAALQTNDSYHARLLATVQHNGLLLRTINRRAWTEELILAAVRSEGRALQFIPNPSRAVIRAADECHLSAHWNQFVFGVMEPVDFRRNGATAFPAYWSHLS